MGCSNDSVPVPMTLLESVQEKHHPTCAVFEHPDDCAAEGHAGDMLMCGHDDCLDWPCIPAQLAQALVESEQRNARTQHWLDEFQGSASTQTLRAVRAEQSLVNSAAGAAALRQMALALIYVDGPEVRETARRELDNIQAGAELIAQLEAAKLALAESERARVAYAEQAKREFERLTAELQGWRLRCESAEKKIPADSSADEWQTIASRQADEIKDLETSYDFVSAEKDAALAECARLKRMLQSARSTLMQAHDACGQPWLSDVITAALARTAESSV